jgi:tetratricopeptide (TPR) repeat protein
MIGGVARRVSSPVLVGRDAEVAQLRAALELAAAGRPGTVVVAGEAGVGKTRLVAELLGEAAGRGAVALTGGCLDVGEGVLAYAPLVEALRPLPSVTEPAELERVLGGARAEPARLVPELGSPAEAGGTPASAPLAPTRLFELLLGVLHRLAETGPLLVVVEDLHWADQSTRDLLGFLVRNLRGGVALVLTYRSDELHRRHPLRPFLAELDRSGRAEHLELGRLGRRAVAGLLTGILGEPAPPPLVGEVLGRSEGNPFFAEELVAAHLDGTRLLLALRELVLARVQALSEPTQRVLEVAAVAGTRVDHQLLAEVVGQDPEQLVGLLREAVTRHAVEWGQLAYHWYAAHDLGQALVASVRAGQAAESASALAEAVGHYERALALWDQVPEAAARSPLDRGTVLHRAADAANLAGDDERSIALGRLALDRVDAAAEPRRAEALLERLARYHWTAAHTPLAMAAVERAVAIIPPEPPSEELARALAAHGQLLMLLDHTARTPRRCWWDWPRPPCGTAARPTRGPPRPTPWSSWPARTSPTGPPSCAAPGWPSRPRWPSRPGTATPRPRSGPPASWPTPCSSGPGRRSPRRAWCRPRPCRQACAPSRPSGRGPPGRATPTRGRRAPGPGRCSATPGRPATPAGGRPRRCWQRGRPARRRPRPWPGRGPWPTGWGRGCWPPRSRRWPAGPGSSRRSPRTAPRPTARPRSRRR